MNATSTTIETQFVNLYLENFDMLREGVSDYVNQFRSEAIENFNMVGIPNRKVEKYKYTDLQQVFSKEYEKYFSPRKIDFALKDIFSCNVPQLNTYELFLINGFYFSEGEKLTCLPNGVIFGSMAAASLEYPELFKEHYNRYADNNNEGVTALNTAFVQDGVFVYIPKSAVLDKPIQLIRILMGNEDVLVQSRNLIIAEENAQAKLILCDHTVSNNHFLSNTVSEIYIAPRANVEVVRMQNEHNNSAHISSDYVKQETESVYTSNAITLHGGMVRNNTNIELAGERCENHSYGIFLSDKTQHVDTFTFVDHAVPNCNSNQLFKSILDEESTGAFNGRILVRPDAQKTLAFQQNNNIILTTEAKMQVKPQLEIYADDVKCSHGATVGHLDEEALFYMRSRGVGEKDARLLQLIGFANDVIQKIGVPSLQEKVSLLVSKRLSGELPVCESCQLNCC